MIGAFASFQIAMRLSSIILAMLLAGALAAPATAAADEWLAGDGHVHTCYSHDSYCPPNDDNTGPETFYSSLGTVANRFAEARLKGLDFLVISDHDDVRAWDDPGFGAHGVIGVHAYEHSLPGGHAHVLGARSRQPKIDDVQAVADGARSEGALFQANHPTYKGERPLAGCEDLASADGPLHWQYGYSVRPDTLEVWNATTLLQPAEVFWECWLQQGWKIPATAGSDSHGSNQANVGLPTLWTLASDRSEQAVLDAIRAGRTTITRLPPNLGAARLLLEADADRDGTFESTMGDTVAPGTPMRVRADGLTAPATVRVRANGATLLEAALAPGADVRFDAPPEATGWVRASLLGPQDSAAVDPFCRQGNPASDASLDFCTADLAYFAMTSPIYVAAPSVETTAKRTRKPKKPKRSAPPPPQTLGRSDEPDDDGPMPPAAQSMNGARLPVIAARR
jgi:hypothetical protein